MNDPSKKKMIDNNFSAPRTQILKQKVKFLLMNRAHITDRANLRTWPAMCARFASHTVVREAHWERDS